MEDCRLQRASGRTVIASLTAGPWRGNEVNGRQSTCSPPPSTATGPGSGKPRKRRKIRSVFKRLGQVRRKANERERQRIATLRVAFEGLLKALPSELCSSQMSRRYVLEQSIWYITLLREMLGDSEYHVTSSNSTVEGFSESEPLPTTTTNIDLDVARFASLPGKRSQSNSPSHFKFGMEAKGVRPTSLQWSPCRRRRAPRQPRCEQRQSDHQTSNPSPEDSLNDQTSSPEDSSNYQTSSPEDSGSHQTPDGTRLLSDAVATFSPPGGAEHVLRRGSSAESGVSSLSPVSTPEQTNWPRLRLFTEEDNVWQNNEFQTGKMIDAYLANNLREDVDLIAPLVNSALPDPAQMEQRLLLDLLTQFY